MYLFSTSGHCLFFFQVVSSVGQQWDLTGSVDTNVIPGLVGVAARDFKSDAITFSVSHIRPFHQPADVVCDDTAEYVSVRPSDTLYFQPTTHHLPTSANDQSIAIHNPPSVDLSTA